MPKIATHNSRYSSQEVENLVLRVATALSKLKLNPEKPIALHVDISLHGVVLVLAVIRLGLKVAFCPLREPVSVIKSWLADLDINILICSKDCEIPSDNKIKVYDLKNIISHSFISIINKSNNFISYMRTSGTTSMPKSALISFLSHSNSALSVSNYFNFNNQQSWALSLPIYHVSGLSIIFRAMLQDAEIYIAPDHEALLGGLKSQAFSHCSVVPAQLKRLLSEDVDIAHLKALIIGGDSLKAKDREQALRKGCKLYESYGMCETASMIAVKSSKIISLTTILPHAYIKVNAEHEICVKATSLFLGYWSDGKLSQNLCEDGFFATGDLATSESLSNLELINRKNNRIISGGENIQAEEIERILEQHEAILECVVVPIADAKMGARPVAFMKWLNEPLCDHDIYQFLAPKLASYKFPVRILSYPPDTPQGLKKPRRWFFNSLN